MCYHTKQRRGGGGTVAARWRRNGRLYVTRVHSVIVWQRRGGSVVYSVTTPPCWIYSNVVLFLNYFQQITSFYTDTYINTITPFSQQRERQNPFSTCYDPGIISFASLTPINLLIHTPRFRVLLTRPFFKRSQSDNGMSVLVFLFYHPTCNVT